MPSGTTASNARRVLAAKLAALRRHRLVDADCPAPATPGAAFGPQQRPAIAAEQDAVAIVRHVLAAVGAARRKEQIQTGPHAGVGPAAEPAAHARHEVAELGEAPEHCRSVGCSFRCVSGRRRRPPLRPIWTEQKLRPTVGASQRPTVRSREGVSLALAAGTAQQIPMQV